LTNFLLRLRTQLLERRRHVAEGTADIPLLPSRMQLCYAPGEEPIQHAVELFGAARMLPPTDQAAQGKDYAASRRLHVPFVFASNGHLSAEYDRFSGLTSAPRPLADFHTPETLRTRYEAGMGFALADSRARPLLVRYSDGEATRLLIAASRLGNATPGWRLGNNIKLGSAPSLGRTH
jgi:hypothetical protein